MTTNSKEWIQYLIASIMVLSGIALAYFSFLSNAEINNMFRKIDKKIDEIK